MSTTWLTADDLKEVYGEDDFPVDENDQTNLTVVGGAIEDAQFFIEGYLRKAGIELPANAEIIRQLNKAALVITRYYYSFNTSAMSEELIREYETMRKFLSDIATGKIVLDDGLGGVANKKGTLSNIEIFIL